MFDDDPGVMSEVETSATGFRRSSRARSSLPIVRTPYKTQDRSLGLVFLQYRNETKRALLPNEITTIDTVRALFVRSFPRQLTMDYLESRNVRIYIHDSGKNMFYELEDLKDVRDRSVLRIYEQDSSNGAWLPVGSVKPIISSQFNIPNQQQFNQQPQPPNVPKHAPPKPQRSFQALTLPSSSSPRPIPPQAIYSGQLRVAPSPGAAFSSANMQQPVMQGSGTQAMQNTAIRGHIHAFNAYSNRPLPERPYSVAGHYPTLDNRRSHPDFSGYLSSPERRLINGETIVPASPRTSLPPHGFNISHDDIYGTYGTRSANVGPIVDEEARIRVEYMEKQLANLTGLVKKALTTNQPIKPPIEPKGSEKSSGHHKPPPPPKPASLSTSTKGSNDGGSASGKNISLSSDTYNQLKQLKRRIKDLKGELKSVRRIAQNQTIIAKETLCDASAKIKATFTLMTPSDPSEKSLRFNRLKISRDEEMYKLDVGRLEKDLNELENQVERLRHNVINRRCRVNMGDVEAMALVLSRASKTVADLKTRFPHLQDSLRTIISHEKDILTREEEFLRQEPERLDFALCRCKKLTGTLVTLKRLASVQDQRCTPTSNQSSKLEKSASADSHTDSNKESTLIARSIEGDVHTVIHVTPATPTSKTSDLAADSSLDSLLNELQTFSKPLIPEHRTNERPKRSESTRKPAPAPPPRSSSNMSDSQDDKRPIISSSASGRHEQNSSVIRSNSEPTPPQLAQFRSKSLTDTESIIKFGFPGGDATNEQLKVVPSDSETSLSSLGSQSSIVEACKSGKTRKQVLEERHQELLRKQKMLQDQYIQLQQLSKGELPNILLNDLKKTGSESNILLKSTQSMPVSGSLSHLPTNKKPFQSNAESQIRADNISAHSNSVDSKANANVKTPIKHETQKIYETDIL